ncbi:MAG: efflux RND transporter periplasmic adaptor subunit [Pseudomonadota bacterium]
MDILTKRICSHVRQRIRLHVVLRAALFGVLLVLLSTGCEEEDAIVERLRPVKAMTVLSADTSTRTRSFSGTAQTAQEVRLSFRVNGTVVDVAVAVGNRVSSGSLIAALDDEPYRVAIEEARADLAQANASRRSSEAEYQRVRQLYTADNASRTELDEALASAEASRADYEARAQALRRAELDLSYTQLTADRDCSVARVTVEVNENVSSGTEIVRLNCGDTWEVLIDVPESQISAFANDMDASVRFPSIQGRQFRAVVSEVGVASAGNTSFPVTLRLIETPEAIRSNLAAEVSVLLRESEAANEAIVVPASAVSQDQNGTFVYLLERSQEPDVAVLRRHAVSVAEITKRGIEIAEGLEDGQSILVAGHSNARDGMRVLQR